MSRGFFFRALPCLVVCVPLLGGCAHVHTEWVPTRYLAHLDGRYALDLETNQCAHACYDGAKGDGDRFYRCLATCPNVDVTDESTCDDEAEPPIAFCYTQLRTVEVEDPSSENESVSSSSDGGSFLFDLIGAVVESAINSGRSGQCGDCASGGSGEATPSNAHEGRPRPRREDEPQRPSRPHSDESSKPEKRVYQPSTPHRTDERE